MPMPKILPPNPPPPEQPPEQQGPFVVVASKLQRQVYPSLLSIKTFRKHSLMNYFCTALGSYQQRYNIEVRKTKVLQYLAISPTGFY